MENVDIVKNEELDFSNFTLQELSEQLSLINTKHKLVRIVATALLNGRLTERDLEV